ncbi:MAG: TetR/AcrR family transcriptional regulator [Streptosporangiaceae bacterium]|nr:TetR/AcrR family transcriptional regulator [Streptosporangiaceae bacterium]
MQFTLDTRQRDVHDAEVEDDHEGRDENEGKLAGLMFTGLMCTGLMCTGLMCRGRGGGHDSNQIRNGSFRISGGCNWVVSRDIPDSRGESDGTGGGSADAAAASGGAATGGGAAARGRPRSSEADRAILAAASSLLAERGLAAMSIEEVAARAGVGKATIYRRWPSKGLLALDAFAASFRAEQPLPDTGSLRDDLRAALRTWVRAVTMTPVGRLLSPLIGAAQHDPELHAAWRERVLEPLRAQHRVMLARAAERGEIQASTDFEVVLDLFFGAAQHRLLLGHLPMTERFIESVVDVIVDGISTPQLRFRSGYSKVTVGSGRRSLGWLCRTDGCFRSEKSGNVQPAMRQSRRLTGSAGPARLGRSAGPAGLRPARLGRRGCGRLGRRSLGWPCRRDGRFLVRNA